MENETTVKEDSRTFTVVLSQVDERLRFMLGKLLTVIDASYASSAQSKAIKDLVKNEVYSAMYDISEKKKEASDPCPTLPEKQ
jgi:hypothetical protein